MSQTYKDRHDSEIYGSRLVIFRRKDAPADGPFSFRAKIDGTKGYIRRTTKETNPHKAMMLAESGYEDLRVRHKGRFSLKELLVDKLFESWLETQKTQLTDTRYKWKLSVYEQYVSDLMGGKNLEDLNKKIVDWYWHYRLNFWNTETREPNSMTSASVQLQSKVCK